MKTFNYKTFYGNFKLSLRVSHYTYDNSLAVVAYDEETQEPFGTITVCLSAPLKANHQFVDVNNLDGIEQFLTDNKIAKPTGRMRQSGFVSYPEYEFNKKLLRELDSEGYERYEQVNS